MDLPIFSHCIKDGSWYEVEHWLIMCRNCFHIFDNLITNFIILSWVCHSLHVVSSLP